MSGKVFNWLREVPAIFETAVMVCFTVLFTPHSLLEKHTLVTSVIISVAISVRTFLHMQEFYIHTLCQHGASLALTFLAFPYPEQITFLSHFIQWSNRWLRALLRGPAVDSLVDLGFKLTTFQAVAQHLNH